ncbi:hypothetical protein Curi_c16520 [Gottschalkia acidurici 9a]|uniref:Uncharacterized protein n=1 Tax=Gottschalkia acidurici (strain ATCC 7906 / DSM 604 / BCRC 14475 / CIP 104303 / KCTC 5404 / NCIMB 10678 / 9a) TaxID=1128398 RepID=K0AZG3_GOTA9|nr:hypothetical protein [Gottschalkia acidurici]AFS78659.1 hypothetical protein Curi_c16520 [Gottschalkia acidurici 9a]
MAYHTNNIEKDSHTHGGKVPDGEDILNYDFKNPDLRYDTVKIDCDHHIYFKK